MQHIDFSYKNIQNTPPDNGGSAGSSQQPTQLSLPNVPVPQDDPTPPHRAKKRRRGRPKKRGRKPHVEITALAPDLPAPQAQTKNLSSIILNNGKTDTGHPSSLRIPTFSRLKKNLFFSVTHDNLPELLQDLNDQIFTVKRDKHLSNRKRRDELRRLASVKSTILRDYLDSALSAAMPDATWKKLTATNGQGKTVQDQSNWWEWSNMLRTAIGIAAGVKNETVYDKDGKLIKRRKFAVYNWLRCYRHKRNDAIMVEYDDTSKKYVSVRGCSDPNCPVCKEKDRRKQYGEAHDHLKTLVPLHNLKQFFNVTVTVPDEIADKICLLPERDRRTLDKNLMAVLREQMGFEATDNLWGIHAFHPVGDSRKMDDRGHWHMAAVPLAVRKTGKKQYKTETRTDVFLIDRVELENKMRAEIQKYFDFQMDQIVVHLEYVPLQKKDWEKRTYHKIKYIMRSFGNDFMEKILRYDPETGLVILQHGAENEYVVTTVNNYARQWIRVNEQRTGSFYGALRMREKFADILGLKRIVGPKIPEPTFVQMVKLVLERGLKAVQVKNQRDTSIDDGYLMSPKQLRIQVQWIREHYVYEYDEAGNEILVPPDTYNMGPRGREKQWVPLEQHYEKAA